METTEIGLQFLLLGYMPFIKLAIEFFLIIVVIFTLIRINKALRIYIRNNS